MNRLYLGVLELNRLEYRHSFLLQKRYWDSNPGHNATSLCSRPFDTLHKKDTRSVSNNV